MITALKIMHTRTIHKTNHGKVTKVHEKQQQKSLGFQNPRKLTVLQERVFRERRLLAFRVSKSLVFLRHLLRSEFHERVLSLEIESGKSLAGRSPHRRAIEEYWRWKKKLWRILGKDGDKRWLEVRNSPTHQMRNYSNGDKGWLERWRILGKDGDKAWLEVRNSPTHQMRNCSNGLLQVMACMGWKSKNAKKRRPLKCTKLRISPR
ncbi:hypothetical protein ACLOJK_038773 [Asimina triloba]